MTTHNPNYPLWCDSSVLLLGNDFQLFGKAKDVMTKQNLSQLYGSEIEIIEHGNYRACVQCVDSYFPKGEE